MVTVKVNNIFLVGPMGAGKSTIGRHIANALNLDFYDTDQEIEKRTGAEIAWIFDIEGEKGFRLREQHVVDELTQKQSIVLATGGGVILASENRSALASRGTVIYLKTSLEQQFERTKNDRKRPLLQTDNLTERLIELGEQRKPLYEEIADYTFDTDGLTVKAVANKIIKHLKSE